MRSEIPVLWDESGEDCSVREQSSLARDALPGSIDFRPCINIAPAQDQRLTVLGPFSAEDSGDHDAIAVGMRNHFLGDEGVRRGSVVLDVRQELIPVTKRPVVVNVNHTGSEDMGERGDILALLRAVPDGFERQDLALILGELRFFLCEKNKRSDGKTEKCENSSHK